MEPLVPVTLQLNVTWEGCEYGAKTKRDASATRECVSHLRKERKWPPLPRYLTYYSLRSRSEAQSAGATVSERAVKPVDFSLRI